MTQASTTPKTSAELRRAFVDFFVSRGHTSVPSSPLVPGDPSLLFATAGMVQFKPYYTAGGEVPYTRAVSVQKCLRLTDLENVGLTPRHDTFFEMLGNFSFGAKDRGAYFQEEAISFAWDFVTQVLQLPKERVYISIFEGEGALPRDDEAAELWKKIGISADHIVPLGRADNFWGPAGGQGACGPSSELYFDLGEKPPADYPKGTFWGERPGDPGDRFMEFWNLVFPQYDAQPDGALRRLPRPGIDTGMGLERLALMMQGKTSIFETDVFAPLVEHVLDLGKPDAAHADLARRDARVIADHVRGLTFAIAEGALPGNEGAGYVLRRLLRRAVTRGRRRVGLALTEPFLSPLAAQAIDIFGAHYRELVSHRDQILRVLEHEEAGFAQTFEGGRNRLEELFSTGHKTITGQDAFVLHDTYGFPIELTEEIARERGVAVHRDAFDAAMEEQRARARASSRFGKVGEAERAPWIAVTEGADSEFVGYEALHAGKLTLRRWRTHGTKGELELVLDRTPCYAESGGQVADLGRIESIGIVAELTHVYREDEHIVHRVRLTHGDQASLLSAGERSGLKASISPAHRFPTMRHHTATHLLHAALRQVLGDHVRQAGSLVAPERLRFDYTHFESPSAGQLAEIERLVMEWVLRNKDVSWTVMPIAEAKAQGAMALFGEKYGAEVRMVTVEGSQSAGLPVSRELCGGTHVRRTGDIGAFILVGDSAIASGTRRIEALCGHQALQHLKGQEQLLAQTADLLQTAPVALPEQVLKLREENDKLKKAIAEQEKGGLEAEMAKLAGSATEAPGGRWLVAEITSGADANAVREAADKLRGTLGRGAAVLALSAGDKLTFLAAVTDDLVKEKKLRADDLVRGVAKIAGGSGGGKPHLALAGAKDAGKLEDALAEARRLLSEAFAE
jgi:alanyl-tRNA synthetase